MANEYKLSYSGREINEKLRKVDCENTVSKTFSNVLKASATGESVVITDISPVEHNIKVNVSSQNLCDNIWETGIIDGKTGNHMYSDEVKNRTHSKNYIPVKYGENYIFSGFEFDVTNIKNILIYEYAEDYTYNLVTNLSLSGYIYTPSKPTTKYIRFSLNSTNLDINNMPLVQFERGTVATPYKDYIDVSETKLLAQGKNLWKHSASYELEGSGAANVLVEDKVSFPLGYYTFSCNIEVKNITANASNSIIVYVYIVREDGTTSVYSVIRANTKSGKVSFTIDGTTSKIRRMDLTQHANFISGTAKLSDIQLEIGEVATEYEPYKPPIEHTVNADGTVGGVKSIFPTTTLTTDTIGVVIDVEYNRDINKAFTELQQAIISLGGNI